MQSLVAAASNEWSRMRFMVMFLLEYAAYIALRRKATASALKSLTVTLSAVSNCKDSEYCFRLLKQFFTFLLYFSYFDWKIHFVKPKIIKVYNIISD